MIVNRRWAYFTGTKKCPVPADPDNRTPDEDEMIEAWEYSDSVAGYLLSQRLPDTTVMRLSSCNTTKKKWDLVTSEYQAKSHFAQADLHQSFMDMRCAKGGDVREFLASLCYKREELAAAGVPVSDKEYERTILRGIPTDLATFASQILSSVLVIQSAAPINIDALINLINEEAERLKSRRTRGHSGQGGKKDATTDEALAATSSEGGKKKRRKGNCHNCGKAGHWARECRSPKKEKDDSAGTTTAQTSSTSHKPDNKPVGSANAITVHDEEGDGFWMVEDEAVVPAPNVSAEPDPLLGAPDEIEDAPHREEEETILSEEEWLGAVITPGDETDNRIRVELYDSGATRHISPYKSDFTSYAPLSPPIFLNTANQQRFPAVGRGTLTVQVPNAGTESELILHGALHAPAVSYTLVSIAALDEEGYHTHIGAGHLELVSPQGERIGRIPRTPGRLYKVVHALDSANAVEPVSIMELHRRMGHIAASSARKLVESGAVVGIELDPGTQEADCDACIYARATRLPISKVRISPPAQNFGDEIHTDVWGPSPVTSRQGRRYFITFTDDATRYTTTFLLRTKDEALAAYKSYEAWAITQQNCKAIKVLRSDRGGEFLSKAFDDHLAKAGTARKLTPHDTPQLNGVAERLNRTLLERMRALMHTTGLPKSLWGEALRHSAWLKNRTATRSLDGKTPFEALYGRPPDLSALRTWGIPVLVHSTDGSKLHARAREARWLGLDVDTKAHRVYWPGPGNVTVERNVYFGTSAQPEGEEEDLPVPGVEQTAAPPSPSISPSLDTPNTPSTPAKTPTRAVQPELREELLTPLRRSTRIRKPSRIIRDAQSGEGTTSARGVLPQTTPHPPIPDLVEAEEEEEEAGEAWAIVDGDPTLLEEFEGLVNVFMAETADSEALEPRTIAEAKRRSDWPEWEKAILEELETLRAAGTWILEEAPPGANIIGSKWVFKAKKDAAGFIARLKARLVAQGFSQIGGIDFDDTYAPVARLASSRAIIAMANRLDLLLHQVDIKGAYLNGELNDNEVLYMQHPPGYKSPDAGNRVLRLKKTLYGLKQSGRRWYQKLSSIFSSLGFSCCSVDQAVFYKSDKDRTKITIVAVHVDDCTIAASSLRLIDDFKAGLRKHVEVTDLGELHWMLGLEIKRDREGRTIHISQRAYLDSILRRFHFDDLKPLSTPMDTSFRLTKEQAPASAAEHAIMRHVPYREAVGALNWAALATRPDIAFAVATVARFASAPGPAHWEAVKRIFRYLAGTRDLWLTYGETQRTLEGYADADGSMAEDRRAITGYAFLIDGGAVSWSSKRQEIVSLSTTESEYVAATHGMKEALWLRSLLSETFGPFTGATTLFSDNQAAIALTRDHQYHSRTKHIDVRYHFIRWVIEKGSLRLIYCPTNDMVADTLTKALPSVKVKHFAAGLGLRAK
jgi:transposase InsO family protein